MRSGKTTSGAGGDRVPIVEVLYLDGCPQYEGAVEVVRRIAAELGVDPEIRLINVPDAETASRRRFLGSPTVRVHGRDVEAGANERSDYVLSCRLYRTDAGISGAPGEALIRQALLQTP